MNSTHPYIEALHHMKPRPKAKADPVAIPQREIDRIIAEGKNSPKLKTLLRKMRQNRKEAAAEAIPMVGVKKDRGYKDKALINFSRGLVTV
jgi:hypothetical protein